MNTLAEVLLFFATCAIAGCFVVGAYTVLGVLAGIAATMAFWAVFAGTLGALVTGRWRAVR